MSRLIVDTPSGPAWIDLDLASSDGTASQLLVIGHGAGGSVDSPDILAVKRECLKSGISVARVTQPYRVAGKKAPPRGPILDAAWASVLAELASQPTIAPATRIIFSGRSSGARVAARCASDPAFAVKPAAVVAIAFPVHPPGKPDVSRIAELDAVTVPVLVVQGKSDPFGMPGRRKGRKTVTVEDDHGLRKSAGQVGEIVAGWIITLQPEPST
jgi:predicted alpha/beta-hydrolase family hydrolase